MEVKPTGPGGNLPSVSNNNQQVGDKPFPGPAEPSGITGTPEQQDLPLSSVLANFSKADLQDPAKVDQMVSQCAGGLLGQALEQSNATLSPTETSYLTSTLQNDPSVRSKLLNYLEKTLK